MDKNILFRFFSGKATHEEEEQINEWMDSSEENRLEFFKERKLFDAIVLWNDDGCIEKKHSFSYSIFLKRVLEAAAIITITWLVTSYFVNKKEKPVEVAMTTIRVPAGQRVNILLPDGTSVWLNARTVFTFPSVFASNQRLTTLTGEAWFEVAPDKKKPFIVESEKYKVEALGTKFNVRSYSNPAGFETALMEGKVKLSSIDDPSDTLTLSPNTRAFKKVGKLQVVAITDYDPYRWKDGLICFKNQPFNQIIYELEKSFGIQIVVNNKRVKNYTFTGKFKQSDGVNEILRVIQHNISFKYFRDDEKQIIYIN